jgi:hypothetical protein
MSQVSVIVIAVVAEAVSGHSVGVALCIAWLALSWVAAIA